MEEVVEIPNTLDNFAEFLAASNYIWSIDNWVPLFEPETKGVFEMQIVPILNLRLSMDPETHVWAYGSNGEFIATAKDNSRQVVIDYATGYATIFTGGVVYMISKEGATTSHHDTYR